MASKSKEKAEAPKTGLLIDLVADRTAIKELTVATDALVARSATYIVRTNDEYRQAAEHRKNAKQLFNQLENMRLSITRPIDAAKTAVMAIFTPLQENVTTHVIKPIDTAMLAYEDEQKRLERIEQDRLEEIARRARQKAEELAAETRRKAEEKAAEERRAAEQLRKQEDDARKAAEKARAEGDQAAANEASRAAAAASKEATRFEKAAERTQVRGIERAAVHEERAATTIAPMVSRALPKTPGVHTTGYWTFEVTNPALVPREYLCVDEAKIGRVVRAVSGEIAIAGIRIYEQRTKVGSAK